jgi:hypothetical protein
MHFQKEVQFIQMIYLLGIYIMLKWVSLYRLYLTKGGIIITNKILFWSKIVSRSNIKCHKEIILLFQMYVWVLEKNT